MRWLVFIGAALAPAAALQAAPCTTYEADAVQVGERTYDPADPGYKVVTIQLERDPEPLDNSCQSAEIEITEQSGFTIALRNGGNELETRFVRSSQFAQPGDNLVRLTGNARRGLLRDRILLFDMLEAQPGQFVPPGEYSAVLSMRVGNGLPVSFRVGLFVAPSVMLLDGGATRNLSLGEVSDGGFASSDFMYRTNASLLVTAFSDNQGTLQHEGGKAFGRIPYTARIDGRVLDLTGQSPITLPFVDSRKRAGTLAVTVEPQPEAFAGIYRDTLTMTFTAN